MPLHNGPRPVGSFPKTGLRSHRHHQHHGSYAPDQFERHETPVPVRSNALEVRFHCVRQASGSGPIFMINFSQTALSASDMNAAFMSYDLVPMVPE
jgi:hypothetical protein